MRGLIALLALLLLAGVAAAAKPDRPTQPPRPVLSDPDEDEEDDFDGSGSGEPCAEGEIYFGGMCVEPGYICEGSCKCPASATGKDCARCQVNAADDIVCLACTGTRVRGDAICCVHK